MADDVNNRRAGVNSIGSGQSRYMEELARMDERARALTSEMRQLEDGISSKISKMGEIGEKRMELSDARRSGGAIPRSAFEVLGLRKNAVNKIMGMSRGDQWSEFDRRATRAEDELLGSSGVLEKEMDARERQMEASAARGFKVSIAGLTRSAGVESESRRMAGLPTNLIRGQRLAGQVGDTELDQRIAANRNEQLKHAFSVHQAALGIEGEGGRDYFAYTAGKLNTAQSMGAQLQAARQHHAQAGTDFTGQLTSGEALSGRIGSKQRADALSQMVAGGGFNLNTEKGKLEEIGRAFQTTFEKLKRATEEGAEGTEELRAATERLSSSYKQQEAIVGEVGRQGSGPSGPSSLDRFTSFARATSGVGSALADVMQYDAVTSNIAQVSLRAQMAGVTNQRYFDSFDATQGNMAALRRVSSGQFDREAAFGMGVGRRMQDVLQTKVGVAGVDWAANVASATGQEIDKGAVGIVGGLPVGALKGTLDSTSNISSGLISAIDYSKNISASASALERYRAGMQLEDTLNAIPDAAKQRLFDVNKSGFAGIQGFGSGASGAFNTMMNRGNMMGFATLGMGPEEMQGLMGRGAASMGAAFIGSPNQGMGIVGRAAQLQQGRLMSADQYMNAVSQMTAIGGGQGNVEEILANAVTRGVDNAKNLMDLVGAVGSLASRDAARGVDVSIGMQRSLMGGLGALSGSGLSAIMAQNAAITGVERANQITGDMGMNFPSVAKFAEISRIGGMSRTGQASLAGVNAAQARQLSSMLSGGANINALRTTALQMGAGELLFGANGELRGDASSRMSQFMDVQARTLIRNTAGTTSPEQQKMLMDVYRGSRTFESLPLALQQIAYADRQGWGIGGAAGIGAMTGKFAVGKFNSSLTGDAATMAGIQAIGHQADVNRVGQASDMIEAGGPKGMSALQQIAAQMARVANSLDVTKAAGASVAAAEGMTLSVRDFNGGVARFNQAVDRLVRGAGTEIGGSAYAKLDAIYNWIHNHTGSAGATMSNVGLPSTDGNLRAKHGR